jgi:hypothetical protein
LAANLRESFKKENVDMFLTPAESEQIARELLRFSDTSQKLKDLEKPLKDLQKVLMQFRTDMDIK